MNTKFLNSPLEQFNLIPLINIELPSSITIFNHSISLPLKNVYFDFTNGSLFLIISLITVLLLLRSIKGKFNYLVPSRWQSVLEILYHQSAETVSTTLKSLHYFPVLFTLFLSIFVLNLVGLIPYTFSITAQIIVAFGLSFSVWIGVLALGLYKHQFNFFAHFLPSGSPLLLAPLLIGIEMISYTVRALSLGIRLSANLTAGHLLLAILSTFAWKLFTSNSLLGLVLGSLPSIIITILFGLEAATCLIQAYVFSLLTAIYLSEVTEEH